MYRWTCLQRPHSLLSMHWWWCDWSNSLWRQVVIGWSLFAGGLYSQVVFICRWSLLTDGLYSQIVFIHRWSIFAYGLYLQMFFYSHVIFIRRLYLLAGGLYSQMVISSDSIVLENHKTFNRAKRLFTNFHNTVWAQLITLWFLRIYFSLAFQRQPLRKRYESYDSDDNASETSSVCSERSFSSYGKTSEVSNKRENCFRHCSSGTERLHFIYFTNYCNSEKWKESGVSLITDRGPIVMGDVEIKLCMI